MSRSLYFLSNVIATLRQKYTKCIKSQHSQIISTKYDQLSTPLILKSTRFDTDSRGSEKIQSFSLVFTCAHLINTIISTGFTAETVIQSIQIHILASVSTLRLRLICVNTRLSRSQRNTCDWHNNKSRSSSACLRISIRPDRPTKEKREVIAINCVIWARAKNGDAWDYFNTKTLSVFTLTVKSARREVQVTETHQLLATVNIWLFVSLTACLTRMNIYTELCYVAKVL